MTAIAILTIAVYLTAGYAVGFVVGDWSARRDRAANLTAKHRQQVAAQLALVKSVRL